MTEAVPAARAEPKTTKTHTPQTYFLAVDDLFELKIAQAWLNDKYPDTAGKIVRELPLHRLPRGSVVIPVIRGEDRSNAYAQEREAHSIRAVHVNPKHLVHEVRECKPVSISDFWRDVRDEFDPFGGELNRAEFMDRLSQNASPAAARIHIGTPNVVRLTFV